MLSLWTAALLLTAGCHSSSMKTEPGTNEPLEISDFVGNAACASCHSAEYHAHHGSRHDTTFHKADIASLGSLAPSLGVIPLAGYGLTEQSGQLMMSRSVPTQLSQPLDYVLGSGKFGMTFVTLISADSLQESHMSFFPGRRSWEMTPGQEEPMPGDQVFGRADSPAASRRCIGCHTTTLGAKDLHPDPKFFGVGCESCHGPGRKHIEALKSGDLKAAQMDKLGAWKSTQLNALCGKCHRDTKDVDITNATAMQQTHRFQPYALNRSACRMATGEPLSCLQCHTPHSNASVDAKGYEAVCLSCHESGKTHNASHHVDSKGKPCPVNPASGCIGCHMRPMRAFPKTFIEGAMVDHLISIPPKAP